MMEFALATKVSVFSGLFAVAKAIVVIVVARFRYCLASSWPYTTPPPGVSFPPFLVAGRQLVVVGEAASAPVAFDGLLAHSPAGGVSGRSFAASCPRSAS